MKQQKNIFYYLTLSIAAAFLLLILAFFSSSNVNTIGTYGKLAIGGVFIISCIFGISLAIWPSWHKKFVISRNHSANKQQEKKTNRERQGHHPNCNQFQNHIIKIKNKAYCAGCLGLTIGSIISIFFMMIYLIIASNNSLTTFHFFIILGFIIIGIIYIEIMFPIRHAVIHVISNIFLVIGFLLITIGIFEITGNIIYGVASILLSFLWLDTRIQLSNWHHGLICGNCTEPCKVYK
ncbi:MAG: hypothetical protein JSW06_04350 [Thermoplasmatales archaeon]|nr:MAG: hypothetical protein JSW06_04350 [Thermoplasmatales archaeon]